MRKSWYKNKIFILAALLPLSLLSNIAYSQTVAASKEATNYTVPTNLMRAYEWLNKNTPAGSVVMSPSLETNVDLSVYSHNKIFLARSQNTIAAEDELLNRLYIAYALFLVAPTRLESILQSQAGVFYFFTAKYNSQALDASLRPNKYPLYVLPVEREKKIINDYLNFKLPPQIPYRVDYIFMGPSEKDIGLNPDMVINNLEKIYDAGGVQIYQWRK